MEKNESIKYYLLGMITIIIIIVFLRLIQYNNDVLDNIYNPLFINKKTTTK